MTRSIWKFDIEFGAPDQADTTVLQLPAGAQVLTALMAAEQPTRFDDPRRIELWAEVTVPDDALAPTEDRTFRVAGTGHPLPPRTSLEWLATVRDGPFVWHLLEQLPDAPPPQPSPLDRFTRDDRTAAAGRLPTASNSRQTRLARLLAARRLGLPIVIVSGSSWMTELAEQVGLVGGEWQALDEERGPLAADELVLITEPGAEVPAALRGRTVHHLTVTA